MKLGKKDSLSLLNTNIKIFGYVPSEITSWEISKLLRLLHSIPGKKRVKRVNGIDKYKDILRDLFLGLIVDQTIGCWFIEDRRSNYRQLTIESKKGVIAHRLSYELFIDTIILPQVCHHCDWPGCCNPWHLFNGTHADNIEDARLKGRFDRPKILTSTEKFLLWKHINFPESKNEKYETFKINGD